MTRKRRDGVGPDVTRPRRGVRALGAGLACAGVLAFATPATASASEAATGASGCRSVSAYGIGRDLGNGATEAVVFGDPTVTGTTRGAFTPTSVDGSVVSLAGTVDFRLIRGTLQANVSGTFDTASGRFSVRTTSITGGGGLRGTTGSLSLAGTQDPKGRFTETVRGSLCRTR